MKSKKKAQKASKSALKKSALLSQKTQKILKIISIAAFFGGILLMFPEIRTALAKLFAGGAEHAETAAAALESRFWKTGVHLIIYGLVIFTMLRFEKTAVYLPIVLIVIFSGIMLYALYLRLYMDVSPRSLFEDESMLAASIITRQMGTVLGAPLLFIQSAPALFVVAVKAITLVFGTSESALRIFSLLAYVATVAFSGLVLRKAFKMDMVFAFLGMCLTATFNLYIVYADMLKPYMADTFFVLAVLLVYYYYLEGNIKIQVFTILNCIIVLFSSPALFFIGAVYIYEFMNALFKKDKHPIIRITASGALVLICAIVYSILWLMPVANTHAMQFFWMHYRFEIFTLQADKIKNNIHLVVSLFDRFEYLKYPYIVLFVAGFIVSFVKKNRITKVIGIAILLLIVASHFGKYPIEQRLYNFTYALIIIYAVIFVESVVSYIQRLQFLDKIVVPVLATLVLLVSAGVLIDNHSIIIQYFGKGWYMANNEANPLIQYVQQNIQDGEYLYTYRAANDIVMYKNGYDADRIGNVSNPNIVYGDTIFDWMDRSKLNPELIENQRPWRALQAELEDSPKRKSEIERVRDLKKAYLLFYGGPLPEWTYYGLGKLTQYGTVSEVLNIYNTRLYFFEAAPVALSDLP
ncbi:MAG: hypothetical protein LBT01_01295 [Spirochaetaceae bacterium]|jgi:hypothetical protein|nr:hypothetical protein [Spirochaetaceae bacterium]